MSKNGLFRLQDNTPEAYTNESRDFQLFLRLYDCVNNGTKFYIDSILDSVDTKTIDSSLLSLLKTKLGFFNNTEFSERDLRYILRGFPYLIKDKGSKKAVDDAVYIFMNAKGISVPHKIDVDNALHVIHVDIESALEDTKMLDAMLSFVVPTGYTYDINFYSPQVLTGGFDYRSHGYMLDVSQNQYTGVVRGSAFTLGRGFVEETSPDPDNTVGYRINEASGLYPVISQSSGIAGGNLWAQFSATVSDAVFSYSSSPVGKVLASNGSEWVLRDRSPDDACIELGGVPIRSGALISCVIKYDQRPLRFYNSTAVFTNYSSSVVGTVGSSVSGTTTDPVQGGTFEVRSFSDTNGGENE